MPAYSALGLITIMRGQLNDTAWWSNADLVLFLDTAEKRFVALAPDDALNEVQAVTITTLSATVAGESAASITLPSNFYQYRLAQVRDTTAGTFQTADIIPVEQLFAQARVESAGRAKSGNPLVAIWGNRLYVSGVTVAAVTSGLRLFYLTVLAGITATASTPTVNEMHHPALTEYALFLAYQKIAATDRAQQHLEAFNLYVANLYENVAGRNLSLPSRPTVQRAAQ